MNVVDTHFINTEIGGLFGNLHGNSSARFSRSCGMELPIGFKMTSIVLTQPIRHTDMAQSNFDPFASFYKTGSRTLLESCPPFPLEPNGSGTDS